MNMFRGMSGEREQKNKFSLGDLGWNGDWSWIRSLRDRWLRSSQPPPIIKGIIFYVWIKLPEATSVIDVGRGDDCYSKKGIGRRFDQFPTSMAFISFVLFLFHTLLSSFLSFLLFVFLFFRFSFFSPPPPFSLTVSIIIYLTQHSKLPFDETTITKLTTGAGIHY